MKKCFDIIVLLFVVIMFNACSNEESTSPQYSLDQELSIAERFSICKEIAIYHSEGLKFAYDKLKNIQKDQLYSSEHFFYSATQEEKKIVINSIVKEFMSQKQITDNLSKFDNKFQLRRTNDITSNMGLRSNIQSKALTFFDNSVENVTSQTLVEPIIETAIDSKEFASFSEIEQNEVLFMFAIFMDSSEYWGDNLENWFVAGRPEDPIPPADPAKWWIKVLVCAMMDSRGGTIGSLAGAAGGAAGGAVIGSLAGGVGAVPGAVGGAIGGGVSGGIAGAITASLDACSLVVTDDSDYDSLSIDEILNYITEIGL
jgi:hypothetical protein